MATYRYLVVQFIGINKCVYVWFGMIFRLVCVYVSPKELIYFFGKTFHISKSVNRSTKQKCTQFWGDIQNYIDFVLWKSSKMAQTHIKWTKENKKRKEKIINKMIKFHREKTIRKKRRLFIKCAYAGISQHATKVWHFIEMPNSLSSLVTWMRATGTITSAIIFFCYYCCCCC